MIIFPSALVVSTKEDPHANSELSCNGDKAAVFFLSSYSKSREKGEISVAWTEDSRRLPEGAPFQWTGNHLCLHPAGVGRLASVTVSDRRPTEALPPTPVSGDPRGPLRSDTAVGASVESASAGLDSAKPLGLSNF